MRRFRFGLEKVRKLRRHRERAARLGLAQELSQLAAATEHRKRVEENLAVCREQSAGGHLDPFAAALEIGLTAVLGRVEQAIELAETNVGQAREFYQERRCDLLAMDKLRERLHEIWRRETEADEQMEFDELARIQFAAARRKG